VSHFSDKNPEAYRVLDEAGQLEPAEMVFYAEFALVLWLNEMARRRHTTVSALIPTLLEEKAFGNG
jgi:hypothetical protein